MPVASEVRPARRGPAPVLRTLRPGAPGAPAQAVVLVHPGALDVTSYDVLVDRLPLSTAVHLLDLQGVPAYQQAALDAGRTDLRVSQIADGFAGLVSSVLRPGERWVLVGWSFGGVVSHLMTGLLPEPTRPAHLLLLDSIAPVPGYVAEIEELTTETLLEWFAMYLATKRGRAPVAPLVGLRSLDEVLEAMVACGALLPSTTAAGLGKVYGAYVDGLRRNTRLTADLALPLGSVPTTVVRARHSLLAETGPLGWDRVCPPGLRVLVGEGDHYSMLADPSTTALLTEVVVGALAPAAVPA